MSGVKNRVALVTGAGSANGIGYATANLLRAAGAKVAITSTTERIYQRLEEMGGTAEDTYAITADLTDTKSVKSLIENVEGAIGAIDIVINNAGMVQTGREEPSVLFHHIDSFIQLFSRLPVVPDHDCKMREKAVFLK